MATSHAFTTQDPLGTAAAQMPLPYARDCAIQSGGTHLLSSSYAVNFFYTTCERIS
jgi:hypothetical protein